MASIGFMQLYSVAGGRFDTWAEPQMKRFGVGMVSALPALDQRWTSAWWAKMHAALQHGAG